MNVLFSFTVVVSREARIFTVFELMDCALSDTLWAERSEERTTKTMRVELWSTNLCYLGHKDFNMQQMQQRV